MIPFGVTHGLMMPNSLAHQVMLLAMNLSLGVVAAVYSSTLVTIIAGMGVALFAHAFRDATLAVCRLRLIGPAAVFGKRPFPRFTAGVVWLLVVPGLVEDSVRGAMNETRSNRFLGHSSAQPSTTPHPPQRSCPGILTLGFVGYWGLIRYRQSLLFALALMAASLVLLLVGLKVDEPMSGPCVGGSRSRAE